MYGTNGSDMHERRCPKYQEGLRELSTGKFPPAECMQICRCILTSLESIDHDVGRETIMAKRKRKLTTAEKAERVYDHLHQWKAEASQATANH